MMKVWLHANEGKGSLWRPATEGSTRGLESPCTKYKVLKPELLPVDHLLCSWHIDAGDGHSFDSLIGWLPVV